MSSHVGESSESSCPAGSEVFSHDPSHVLVCKPSPASRKRLRVASYEGRACLTRTQFAVSEVSEVAKDLEASEAEDDHDTCMVDPGTVGNSNSSDPQECTEVGEVGVVGVVSVVSEVGEENRVHVRKRKRVSFTDISKEDWVNFRRDVADARKLFEECMKLPRTELLTESLADKCLRSVQNPALVAAYVIMYAQRVLDVARGDTQEVVWLSRDTRKDARVLMQVTYSTLSRERADVLVRAACAIQCADANL
jgi:hypothetical protein